VPQVGALTDLPVLRRLVLSPTCRGQVTWLPWMPQVGALTDLPVLGVGALTDLPVLGVGAVTDSVK